jgi:hypothetical protein
MEGSRHYSSSGTLDRLVSELTLEERQNLHEKLKEQTNLPVGPLYETNDKEEPADNFETSYNRLPWYYRLYYFILSLLKGHPPVKIYEDSQISSLGREIETAAPGYYDYQRNVLLADFNAQLTNLKESARFFYSALDASVNHDKGGFYTFLGSLEMGDVHRRLQDETDPDTIAGQMPGASGPEIRQRILLNMEDAFSAITEDHRNAMYFNARSLACLKELSSFVFDRVIMAFGIGTAGQTCPANVVKDLLRNLNNILYSLKDPPTMSLLESLFVFKLQEKAGDKDFNISREMQSLLSKADSALETIREFNRNVPLTRILRCVFREMDLCPQQISGGEDWYIVYRDYWKRQIEAKYTEYIQIRKHNDLSNSFRYFLKGTNLKILENVVSESSPDGLPVSEAFTLSFLLTFYSAVFMADINLSLRPILIDGEFLKRENRTEFTESYNDLIKMEDDIKHFEFDISPAGDFGKRYTLAKQDMSSLPIKRRKIQLVLEDASRIASGIIERTRTAMKLMINILNGILKKEPGGKYDTLNNLTQLTAKIPLLVNGMNDSIQKFQTALQLLDDIDAIDSHR